MSFPSFQSVLIAESDRGDRTEDRCLILPRPHGGVLLVVADGVGGRAGGGEAAQLAVDLVSDHQYGVGSEPTAWSALLTYIDGEIADDPQAGETTLVLVDVGPTEICGASVGDSQAYLFATGEPLAGELTQYQQRKPFLGSGAARPMSFACDLPIGGATVLVASDGLFGYVREPAIARITRLPRPRKRRPPAHRRRPWAALAYAVRRCRGGAVSLLFAVASTWRLLGVEPRVIAQKAVASVRASSPPPSSELHGSQPIRPANHFSTFRT